jgi:hypothetical protein
VEQWLARWAHNPKVGGSNPPPATRNRVRSKVKESASHPLLFLTLSKIPHFFIVNESKSESKSDSVGELFGEDEAEKTRE